MSGADAEPALRPGPRVELIGPPGLFDAQGRRTPLERRGAALLALLAIEGPRARAALATLLWPRADPAAARNSLRQRVFRLQRSAGADVVAGHEELRLADGVAVDWADAAARLALDPHAAAGGLLDGHDYGDTIELAEWVDAARARWRRQRVDWLARRASEHEARQQVAPALAYAERLLAEEPTLEHAHRRVMRLHYLRGDRAAALAAFERCVALLDAQFGSPPDRETRELAATIRAAGRSAASPARAVAPTVAVLRPPRLVGRDEVRQRIAAALAARRVVVLHGEPGIGKSRLLEALAADDAASVSTGALAGDAGVPYALLARLAGRAIERFDASLPDWARAELARLVPALGDAPAARVDALRLQQAVAAAVDAWAGAGLRVLVVDDLHHADEASLEALVALVASPARRVAWLLAVRSREVPAALQSWLAGADVDGHELVRVEALDTARIGELLASLELERLDAARWAPALARHSGGNPLFALETVRALLSLGEAAPSPDAARLPVPVALDALIGRRLSRLGDGALRLARVAALAGTDFDADVAAAVLDAHPLDIVEPWRELEDAQLLRDGRFAHDLIAEAVLNGLPDGIARALHARLAGVLATLERGPARVAPHWEAAQDWARAGEAYAEAARGARRSSRRNDEMRLWERAADGFDRAGQPGKAFDARADGVECAILVRGVAAAALLVDRLDADQRTEPQRLRALTARACVCLMGGRAAEAESAARAALAAADRIDARWPRFEAARLLAVALAQQGAAGDALAAIEPFRDWVVAHGDAEQRHHFWADYAYALKAAQRANDTADALRHAMASAQEAGDHAELATLTSNLALIEGNLGRVERALDHARRARALNDPLGLAVGPPAGAIELYVAVHAGALGRYDESLAGFDRAQQCFAGNPGTVWESLCANHRAHVLIHLGQFARARQVLGASGSGGSPVTRARRTLLQARIDRALGGVATHSVADALAEIGGADPLTAMLTRLELTLVAGDPAAAAQACDALVDEAESHEHLAIGMRARLLRLQHRAAAGVLRDDAEVRDAAERLTHCRPADTYFAEGHWILVRACDAVGATDGADAALQQGFSWIADHALPHVPPAFRDSFVQRNRVNRDLLARAAQRLGRQLPPAAITAR